MEFVIGREEFHRALERAQGIVDRRNTVALLANVLIQTTEHGIRLTASDTEVAFTGEYEANVLSPGEITLGARQLFDIVHNLPQESIHLRRMDNNWMEIVSGRSYFKVVGLDAEGYPSIPQLENPVVLKLNAQRFKEMVDHVFFSIANDDSRYGLNGAYLEQIEEDGQSCLRLISTDGHRLSLVDRPIALEDDFSGGYLLPRKGLLELKKLCDEFGDEEMELCLGTNSAVVKHGTVLFFMRLLEGDFPDYRQVIPQRYLRRLVLSREELSKALRRVSILSSEKTHSVRFKVLRGEIEISASNPDLGESREVVEAEVEGEPLAVGFNAKYFLDALSVLKGDRVVLELGDSLNPGILKQEGDTGVMFVIMPMRLE